KAATVTWSLNVGTLHVDVSGTGVSALSRIVGRVTDANTGQALNNVTVNVYDGVGSLATSAVTDATGTYATATRSNSATDYARTSNNSGYSDQLYKNISCALGCNPTSGTRISVANTGVTPPIDFALQPRIGFGGSVTDSGVAPVGGITVALFNSQGVEVQQ